MSQDELPDSDRTILVPKPGGRRATSVAPAAPPASGGSAASRESPASPASSASAAFAGSAAGPGVESGRRPAAAPPPDYQAALAPLSVTPDAHVGGINPLVGAANPLLDLVVPLRIMASHPNVEGLREQLVGAIKKFEGDARALGVETEAIAVARYSLCTFLDETISSTPWGGSGVWASRSLLVAFHNEAFGGEKFFLILQKLCREPRANLHVLELMYICLALGLEGRYRVLEGGRSQLDTLRERLQQLIAKERGPYEQDLSLRWQASTEKRPGLMRLIPVWVIGALAGIILLAIHLSLSFMLNRASDPVYAGLNRIQLQDARPAPPMAHPPVRVAKFLAPEIEQGLLSVTETADRSTIVLHGDGVFQSGSAEVARSYDALLARIGEALKPVPGRVIVIGHTDDVPTTSARYPSNWALSKARAATVVGVLASHAGPATRYSVEGRGETEPLAPNDSPANRARNRRVVIIVLVPASATAAQSQAVRP